MDKPKSIEEKAAAAHPELVKIAAQFCDAIERKEYSSAIDLYLSLFSDAEPTEHEGVSKVTRKEESDIETAQDVLLFVMMKRQ